jgi:hypothetical protein
MRTPRFGCGDCRHLVNANANAISNVNAGTIVWFHASRTSAPDADWPFQNPTLKSLNPPDLPHRDIRRLNYTMLAPRADTTVEGSEINLGLVVGSLVLIALQLGNSSDVLTLGRHRVALALHCLCHAAIAVALCSRLQCGSGQVHIGNFHFLAQLVAQSEYAAWEAWIEQHCFDEAIGNWQP